MIVLTRFPDVNRRAFRGHAALENAINRTRGMYFRTAGLEIRRNHAALAPGSSPRDSKFCRKFARRLTSFSARENATGGSLRILKSEYQSCE
jgi:hypothetical protein